MALDNDTIEAEENAAIDGAGVQLGANGVQRPAGKQSADLAHQRRGHGIAQISPDLPGRALCGLERNVAGEPFGDHHIDGALAQIVAFDEALVGKSGARSFGKDLSGVLDPFIAFGFLDTDVEQPDGRAFDVEQGPRQGRAEDREIDKLLGVGPDCRADVEHDDVGAQGGPYR